MRQVLAIHRHGSFVKAAEEVGVAQPTLSKSIARLEDELGLRLFDRTGTGAKVTPMGALLVRRAQSIIAEAERLDRDIELIAAGQIGEARIGLGPALRRIFLPRFAEALATRHPALRLRLDVETRERLVADLKAGSVDMVICARAPDLAGPDYVQTVILREPFVAVASPDHPLAGRDGITAEEFTRYPSAGAAQPYILPAGAVDGGVSILQEPRIVCNDDSTLRRLAARGLVTVFANRHLVQGALESGELVALRLAWDVSVTVVAVTTRAASHSPILREVAALAEEVGRGLTEGTDDASVSVV